MYKFQNLKPIKGDASFRKFFRNKIKNKRFDCGSKLGFLQANISFALNRKDLSSNLNNWLKTII